MTTKSTAPTLGGRRQSLLHAAAAAGTLVLPLLGASAVPTPIQTEQVATGIAGVILTWLVPDLPTGPGRYLKSAMTALTTIGTALVPYSQGGWQQLAGVSGLIVLAHALATVAGIAAPNDEAGPVAGSAGGQETEVPTTAPPPIAPTSGRPVAAPVEMHTGMLPAVTAVSTPADLTGKA